MHIFVIATHFDWVAWVFITHGTKNSTMSYKHHGLIGAMVLYNVLMIWQVEKNWKKSKKGPNSIIGPIQFKVRGPRDLRK